jgi:hypothetical protein
MALLQAWNPQSGSGPQPPVSLAWERDRVEETDPFSSGYLINLTETPVDENAITVWSQGLVLDTDDYSYNSGTNQITILFSGDPATDTSDGTWIFSVQYPYAT